MTRSLICSNIRINFKKWNPHGHTYGRGAFKKINGSTTFTSIYFIIAILTHRKILHFVHLTQHFPKLVHTHIKLKLTPQTKHNVKDKKRKNFSVF